MEMRRLWPYWKHLRVPFALTLAPIFLWGFFLAGGRASLPAVLCFVGFHFFLYPGVTAYNSAYDRDEGPVGGMLRPPEVPRRLLEFSIVVIALGALLVTPPILPVYVAYALLGFAYSHPNVRLKSHPYSSAAAVAVGQGGLGCLAGWLSGNGDDAVKIVLGGLAASLTTLGLYPVGQVFQVEEDARRGDRTLAVVLGPAKALRFGGVSLLGGGSAASTLMALRFGRLDFALMVVAYLVAYIQLSTFARRFDRGLSNQVTAFRTSMRLTCLTSGAFLLFIAAHWIR